MRPTSDHVGLLVSLCGSPLLGVRRPLVQFSSREKLDSSEAGEDAAR